MFLEIWLSGPKIEIGHTHTYTNNMMISKVHFYFIFRKKSKRAGEL
jgi:hypothetical protein